MPLFNCPICNGVVSQEAATCPHCGHPNPVDPSMIEARLEEEKRQKEETQKRAEIQSQAIGQRSQDLVKDSKPSALVKVTALIAILCAVWATGVHVGRVALDQVWWRHDGIAQFLLHAFMGVFPFLISQILLFLSNMPGKDKLLALTGIVASLLGFLLVLTDAFFLMVVETEGEDYWYSEGILGKLCWHGGEILLFVIGTMFLVFSSSSGRRNKIPAFLSIPFVLLCFGIIVERVVTYQMNDPFGRLSDGDASQTSVLHAQIENILWGADSVCWLMVIILCAIGTLSQSGKSALAKK